MTFTKERLEQFINQPLEHGLTRSEQMEMARQMLAGMEQEPVYQACKEAGVWVDIEPGDAPSLRANGEQVRVLYAAPQLPQPAVDELLKEHLRLVECILVDYREGNSGHAKEWIRHISKSSDNFEEKHSLSPWLWVRSAYRAAMLQGAEPVSQPYTLRDGWVAVPVEMTPEQMRAVQRDSSLGTFASAHLSGAYDMYREFWDVAIAAAPQQEVK